MKFDDPVDYGDVPVLHFKNEYLSSLNGIVPVISEEQ